MFCCLLVVLFLVGSFVIAYEFSHGAAKTTWLLPPLRIFVNLSKGIMFVPILLLTLNMLNCEGAVDEVLACGSGGYYALLCASGFVVLSFTGFSVVMAYVVCDSDVTGKSADARVHGRVECLSLLIRATMVLAFSLVDFFQAELDVGFSRFVLATAILASGIMLAGATFFYLPYYNRYMNCLELGAALVFAWGGVCLVVAQVLNNANGNGAFYTFLCTVPIVFYSGYSLVNRRIRILVACDKEPDSVFATEIMLRYRFPYNMGEWSEKALPKYKEAATERWKNNAFLCLHVAYLSKALGDNTILASQFLRKARTMTLSLDLSFILFKHSLDVAATQSGRGAFSYIAIDHHYSQAEERIAEALEGIVRFWKSQGKPECTAAKLFQHSNKVKRLAECARHHLDKLLELTNGSVRAIRLYAKFRKYILNDNWKAEELILKANALEAEDLENGCKEDVFDIQKNAVAVLGGTEENMGDILQVSDSFCMIFGYRKNQLVGKNISTLMPSPFAEAHTKWLTKRLETTKSSIAVSRKIWGLHKLGHVVALDLYFKSGFDENDCLVFTGKVKLSLDHVRTYLVSKDDGTLMYASESAWTEILRRTPETLPCATGQTMQTLVPRLAELDLGVVHGRPQLLQLYGKSYEVEVTRMPYKSRQMDFIVVVFYQQDGFSESDSIGSFLDLNKKYPKERKATLAQYDTKSYLSGDTAASGSTIAGKQQNIYATLEKNVFKRQKSSSAFLRGCVVCTLLFVSLAVTKYAVTSAKEDIYKVSLDQEYNSMLRSIKLLHLVFAVQIYMLPELNETMLWRERLRLKKFIRESSKTLEEVHHSIESERILGDRFNDGSSRKQTVRVTIDGKTYSNKSLFVAVQEFTNNINSLLASSEGSGCHFSCNYVLRNGVRSIAAACKQSSLVYAAQTESILGLDGLIELVYACTYFVLTVALTVRYLLPFAMSISYIQENTAVALLNIPKTVASSILAKAQAHLVTLKKETDMLYNEANDVGAPDTMKPTQAWNARTARKPAESKLPTPQTKSLLPARRVEFDEKKVPDAKRTKPQKISRKVSPGLATRAKKKGHARKAAEVLKRTMLLVLPFVIPFAIVELALLISAKFVPLSSQDAVVLAGQRAITASWLLVLSDLSENLTRYNRLLPDQNITQTDFAFVSELYGEMVNAHEGLVYGSTSMRDNGFRGVGLIGEPILGTNEFILFRNACFTLCQTHPELQLSVHAKFGLHMAIERGFQGFHGGFAPFSKDLFLLQREGTYIAVRPYDAFLNMLVLSEGLERSLEIHRIREEEHVHRKRQIHLLSMAAFAAFLIYSATWTFRLYSRMIRQVQNTQFILFMVPIKTLLTLPDFDKLINQNAPYY